MPNVLWYYLVAAIGIFLMIFTACKKKHVADLLSFFLFAAAVSYLCEVVILFVFDSYAYKPEVFADSVAEDIFGHLICNGFYWGGFTLFVSAFTLSFGWIVLVSLLFMFTEILFLKLGLYEHHWWKLYMTGLSIIIFLVVMKKWYTVLMKKENRFLRNVTFFIISWLLVLGPSLILLLSGFQNARVGLDSNMYLDHIYFVVPYHLAIGLVIVFFVNYLQKGFWKLLPFLIVFSSDALLVNMNILNFHGDWNLFYLTLLRGLCLAGYILLEKHTLQLKAEV